ncbi:Small RNA-binding protein 11, chloroplastic [Vitis vinifera]|uniref:Small RNA-binding protein 11, chloroplastic n=1 Tax=Vitis vinifera TaxID=29760 RepID=A0A438EK68_VITVI|nr:Small RNA-binding protein 11, chloroplastic [Vitis vinifera]
MVLREAGKLTGRTMSGQFAFLLHHLSLILGLENDRQGLSFYTTEKGLSEHFSQYGQVVEGYYMQELNGRTIFVDYAKPRADFGGGMPIARGPPNQQLIVDYLS